MRISINANIWAKQQWYTNSRQALIYHFTFIAWATYWVWYRWVWGWPFSSISSKYSHSFTSSISKTKAERILSAPIECSVYRLHAFRWRSEGEQVNSYDNLFSRDLRCLRNTIHANLFLTYILAALLWLSITLIYQVSHSICTHKRVRYAHFQPRSLPIRKRLFFGRRPTQFPTMRCWVDDTTMTVDQYAVGNLKFCICLMCTTTPPKRAVRALC